MATEDDRKKLAKFLNESREALGQIITRLDQLAPSPNSMRQRPSTQQAELARAWDAFNGTSDLQGTIDRLERATEDDEELNRLLDSHGLYGDQLAFKIGLFDRHLYAFRQAINEFHEPENDEPENDEPENHEPENHELSQWQRLRTRLRRVRARLRRIVSPGPEEVH